MLPSPLHPAVVHFPIVLMFLLPIAAIVTLWAIAHGSRAVRAWLIPLAVAAALTVSAWAAVETGEQDEDRAEDVAGERAVATHEAAAERFLLLSGAVLVIVAAGLLRGGVGRTARMAGTVAALALVAAGYQVGHSGGQLVYGSGSSPGLVGINAGTPGDAGGHGGEDADRDD
jgi:uncharacterized membrane protein